jgi:hypothetical protein
MINAKDRDPGSAAVCLRRSPLRSGTLRLDRLVRVTSAPHQCRECAQASPDRSDAQACRAAERLRRSQATGRMPVGRAGRRPASLLLRLCFCATSAAAAAEPSPIDSLDQAALQETFRLLRTNYVQRDALTLEELNRAALDGLLKRLDFGAEMVPIEPAAPDSEPALLVSEKLTDALGYVRPSTFSLEELPAFDAALRTLRDAKAGTLILDLRTPAPQGEFVVAAQILGRFLPPDQLLFSLQKPDDPHPQQFRSKEAALWTGKIVLLIDEEANNVAETIAAVLQSMLHPPIFGSATRGRTMEYQTAPISRTHALRFASAEMRLPDGTSLFRKGLAPTIPAAFDPDAKHRSFAAQATEGVKKFINSPERPRHNEQALVARTAPELPFDLAQASGKPTEFDKPPLHDRVLQQAVDVLETQAFLAK